MTTEVEPPSSQQRGRATAVIAALATLVGLTVVWGRHLVATDPELPGTGYPWFGHWGWTVPGSAWPGLVVCGCVAIALTRWWPVACRRLPARWLPLAAAASSLVWAVALAATRGWRAVRRPLLHGAEYLSAVGGIGSPTELLSQFTTELSSYPIHVQGHPPGQLLLLWGLDRLGLEGPWPATVQTLLFGVAATGGALWVTAHEAGSDAMRRAAVFAGLTPAAWTLATSSDATFSGLCAAAVVATFAAERGRGPSAIGLAAIAGGLGALGCYFTYAAPLFMAPAVVPAYRLARQRRFGPIAAALGAAVVVVAAITAAGFAWWDGLAATIDAYHAGVANQRPYRYFVVANLVVFAVAVGPATMVGALRRQPTGLAPLVLAATAAVAVADLTGLSKAEVERIWLPFVPWVALAAGPLAATDSSARRWLAAQLGVAVALQLWFRSPW